jgi:hypothetical protein
MIQENVAAALSGDVIPMVEREVYFAAMEMQLLEGSISNFKAKLHTLIGADSSSNTRRKKVRAFWEDTKEAAKKRVDTALLKEMELVDWAQATNERHAACEAPLGTLGAKGPDLFGRVRIDEARARTCRFSREEPGAGVELGGESASVEGKIRYPE